MPYKSEKQSRYMHANLPEIAARWDAEKPHKSKVKSAAQKAFGGRYA